jgi:penicillin amidase
MRSILRFAVPLLAGLLVLVLLVAAGLVGLAWHTKPPLAGAGAIPGLLGPVEVRFDERAIPTIIAGNENDAAAALGYLHARERLFQMELMRRGASGRLSEVLGSATLRADRFSLALDLRRRAEADYPALPADTRALLDAYARGVNAWIAERGQLAALEFVALGTPEPWTPTDSLLWGKVMGLFLSGNFRTELARLGLAERVERARIEELWPRDTTQGAPGAALPGAADHARRVAAALPEFPTDAPLPSHASNAWVVDARHSASGAPLLANDPHLAFTMPALWYLVRIELPDRTLTGATSPGVPFLVLGQNTGPRGTVAWGFTTTHSDTQDVFVESVTPGRPDHYDTPEGPRPFRMRTVQIPVRFGEPLTLRVRETRHGPVLSDIDPEIGRLAQEPYVLAVSAASLAPGDTSAAGLHRLNRAHSVAEAEAALRLVLSPMQNVMVADNTGAIAMFVVGRLPLRRNGDGAWPVPGWDGVHDWEGFATWEQMPHVRSPASGRIVNANNRIVPEGFTPLISRDWFGDGRYRRIHERLAAQPKHDTASFAAMQNDTMSIPARETRAAMLAGLQPTDATRRRALALLAAWDGDMHADRPEPLIWNAFTRAFTETLLRQSDVPPGSWRESSPEFLTFLLGPGAHWCGGDCTPRRAEALDKAVAQLVELQGENPDEWRWGTAHQVRLLHPVLRLVPGMGRLSGHSAPVGGDATTVLRAAPRGGGGPWAWEAVHGAGYRAAYDLANPAASRFALAGGQSGHPFAAGATDLLEAWARGESFTLARPDEAAPRLTLSPATTMGN